MKIRLFCGMLNDVYRISANTEDWSQGDFELMVQFGEPEVNVGGDISYTFGGESRLKKVGDQFVRVVHGFPFSIGFDSRDFEGGAEEAIAVGSSWKDKLVQSLRNVLSELRLKASQVEPIQSEEIYDNV